MIASAPCSASKIGRRAIPTAERVEHGTQGPSKVAKAMRWAGRFRLSAVLRNDGLPWGEGNRIAVFRSLDINRRMLWVGLPFESQHFSCDIFAKIASVKKFP